MTTTDPQQPAASEYDDNPEFECQECGARATDDGADSLLGWMRDEDGELSFCRNCAHVARPDDTERLREWETQEAWAGVLMRRWGVADSDEDAYDTALADVESLWPHVLADREKAVQQAVEATEARIRVAITQPHERASTEHGPDYCRTCSDAIQEWVTWPCEVVQQARADIAPCSRCGVTKVVNPRSTEDIVICGDCGVAEATAVLVERVEAVLASWQMSESRYITIRNIDADLRAALTEAQA